MHRVMVEVVTHPASPRRLFSTLASALLLACASTVHAEEHAPPSRVPPKETFEIVKVIDGDTIHIQRAGVVEKLRLLHVDTEETLSNGKGSETKPGTVFGTECALWAQDYFKQLGKDGAAPRVGLLFPTGKEERDVYGRLLCHVILPDGTDYNLLLVEQGKSPYFQKYGWSKVLHSEFVAAQTAARKAQKGIWNPKVNEPASKDAPSAKRPYDQLLPWWEARAIAYKAIETEAEKDGSVCSAAEPEQLARAAKSPEKDRVWGEIDRCFEETNGDLTVLMRSGKGKQALRIVVKAEDRAAHEALQLPKRSDDFRQNLLWFEGFVTETDRGWRAVSHDPSHWKAAGPEPSELK
jgi:micrococcal nuclease